MLVADWRLRVLSNSLPPVAIQMLSSGAGALLVKSDNQSIEYICIVLMEMTLATVTMIEVGVEVMIVKGGLCC